MPNRRGSGCGVGCGLNNLQKLEDGEPLSGRKSAQEVFGSAPVAQQPVPYQQPVQASPAMQYQHPSQVPQYSQPAPVTQQPLQYIQGEVDPITGQPIVIDPVTGQRVM